MLRNLPDDYNGRSFPLSFNLEKGVCLELHINKGIIRRGIVYECPTTTMTYMWWQSRTRYVQGEVPKCTTLTDGIPPNKMDALTIEKIPFWDTWLASIPFSIKFHFGNVTPRKSRAKVPVVKAPLSHPAYTSPPWSPPSSPLNCVDPPWTPPYELKTMRKPRKDKGVKRGEQQEALMNNPAINTTMPTIPDNHQPSQQFQPQNKEFHDAVIVLAKFVSAVTGAFNPQT